MPSDFLADPKRLLHETGAMLNALGDLWEHDLALVAQSKIAREHVQAALDVLGETEEMLDVREQAAGSCAS